MGIKIIRILTTHFEALWATGVGQRADGSLAQSCEKDSLSKIWIVIGSRDAGAGGAEFQGGSDTNFSEVIMLSDPRMNFLSPYNDESQIVGNVL